MQKQRTFTVYIESMILPSSSRAFSPAGDSGNIRRAFGEHLWNVGGKQDSAVANGAGRQCRGTARILHQCQHDFIVEFGGEVTGGQIRAHCMQRGLIPEKEYRVVPA
jgi:hypothetical protein